MNTQQHQILLRKETRRRHANRRTRLAAGGPLTGAYYWYPKKGMTWDLMTFFDQEYGDNTLHETVWKEVIQALALSWSLDYRTLRLRLGSSYTALPRGRVSQGFDKKYHILHGNDAPIPASKSIIVRAFNLRAADQAGKLLFVFDEHETRLSDDVSKFRTTTRIPV